ncbi:MAG: peptidoglycan editing factor PgeF [Gammaproteobacteria bacterium]|nr:peptidoglycan editing factor PgeF [Gammaproteobacteria bacterium]NND39393.1 peptidoglycan editing factor PgeF [Pseudomonadales bacterium]MBT8150438.1 peptidoglycan editing factor PgeF [Gammaproteobacteria bacterium]NNL10991.1 peptidoglycan editing factor PgeF [Pseudomonadales bacterium]NNM10616.1 peptidoglycan editing factor PgeF [Pseudomonadales bacterium]
MQALELLCPVWPAPARVRAGVTTRVGGVSSGPFSSFNLGEHVQDDAENVRTNRQQLADFCAKEMSGRNSQTPHRWRWLEQTHSTKVSEFKSSDPNVEPAVASDAGISCSAGEVCVVLTADCLPILLCDNQGKCVGAIHAGWRGLLDGIIDNTVQAMASKLALASTKDCRNIYAWLGPAIGPTKFVVGNDVKKRACEYFSGSGEFSEYEKGCLEAFAPCPEANFNNAGQREKPALIAPLAAEGRGDTIRYTADLYRMATLALHRCGIQHIYGGGFCTASDAQRFFSYRRDGVTGRMASFIYLDD